MNIDIRVVETRNDLKTFVKVPHQILRGNPYWVPLMMRDELMTFDPARNPAYEHAETRLFLAYRDGRPVGRLAGIFSRAANEKYQTKNLRFGWFDVIEDWEAARALFQAAENLAREKGLTTISGPQGFCDMDLEGLLIEGFDTVAPITVRYSPPYYREFVEKYGFRREADYVELKIMRPSKEFLAPFKQMADWVSKRSNFKVIKFKSNRELLRRGKEVFRLYNESYDHLYGTVPLTERQIDYYVKMYAPVIDRRFLRLVEDEQGELAGFAITVPSLSRAFQKARGRLFPFGWWHILRAMRQREIIDFHLIGVARKYQGTGLYLILGVELVESLIDLGFKYAETSHILETNEEMLSLFKTADYTIPRRRSIFKKEVSC
ncbi:MAG: N-acetyltransferase [Deltaproteobacteria bacterium]|nr:N-acetyltransferase [Deltaproteobacteria bacterium]